MKPAVNERWIALDERGAAVLVRNGCATKLKAGPGGAVGNEDERSLRLDRVCTLAKRRLRVSQLDLGSWRSTGLNAECTIKNPDLKLPSFESLGAKIDEDKTVIVPCGNFVHAVIALADKVAGAHFLVCDAQLDPEAGQMLLAAGIRCVQSPAALIRLLNGKPPKTPVILHAHGSVDDDHVAELQAIDGATVYCWVEY